MTLSIPQRLRAAREARGWSLATMAARLDNEITSVAIGSWERGERQPPLRQVPRWAAALGLRLDLVPEVDPTDQDRIQALLMALSGLADLEPEPGELAAILRRPPTVSADLYGGRRA